MPRPPVLTAGPAWGALPVVRDGGWLGVVMATVATAPAPPTVTVADVGNGTFTVAGATAVDNGDGTFTITGATTVDAGNGTFTLTG